MLLTLVLMILLILQVNMQHLINPRLTNGRRTFRNQFPFMASIQIASSELALFSHACSGTVVDKDWILSTGGCVKKITGRHIKARVKIGMYFPGEEGLNIQTIRVAAKIAHESFSISNPSLSKNIGLLKLETSLSDPLIAKLTQSEITLASEVLIIGWGRSTQNYVGTLPEVLKYAEVLLLDHLNCMVRHYDFQHSVQLSNSHLCIHLPGTAITTSSDDVGGPVVRYVNDKPELVGIISWAIHPNNQVGMPIICTNVSHFIDWITEKMSLAELPDEDSESDDLALSLIEPR